MLMTLYAEDHFEKMTIMTKRIKMTKIIKIIKMINGFNINKDKFCESSAR